MSLDTTALLHAGVLFPRPKAVSRFVAVLAAGVPKDPAIPSPTYDPINQIVTVQQINIGSGFRIRAIPNGAVMEVLGADGLWHAQETMTPP